MENSLVDWTKDELNLLNTLNEPIKIQDYLDNLEYDPVPECRSPRWVIMEGKSTCFEGALFAAACLQNIGDEPLLVDLRAVNDDDHVIAVFKKSDCFGSIAKSNFTTLRYREPVYRTLRELVMSYFDFYFNTLGEKTLREYSLPLNLARYNHRKWMTTHEDIEYIGDFLNSIHHYHLITPEMAQELNKVDDTLLQAGLLNSKAEGLYKPKTT